MKKDIKLKVTTFICAALLVLSGCKDESYPEGPTFKEGEGGLSLKELTLDVNTTIKPIVRGGDDIDFSGFNIKILDAATGKSVSEMTYGSMPEIVKLDAGSYILNVESCNCDKVAEWEDPHYLGTWAFDVKPGEITKAKDKVMCDLNNVRVTVKYDDELMSIVDEDAKTIVKAGTQDAKLEYGLKEVGDSTSGYFRVFENNRTLVSSLVYSYRGEKQDPVTYTMNDIQPGQHRIIKYKCIISRPNLPDITGGVSRGEIKINIDIITENIDGTITIEEVVIGDVSDRPGKEDPLDPVNPDDPTPPTPPTGNDDIEVPNPADEGLTYFDLNKVNEVKKGETTGRQYLLTINSKKGFSSLKVKIDSETLTESVLGDVGLSPEFDLATGKSIPDGDNLTEGLESMGFPVGDKVTGSDIISIKFNITEFVPLLCIYGEANHTFVLTITDKEGKSKTVELKFHSN